MKGRKKKRKSNPPHEKTINVLLLIRFLSGCTLSIGRIMALFDISKRAVYRYRKTIESSGLHMFASPVEGGGEEATSYSLWPDIGEEIVKVTVEFGDGSEHEFLPDELAIMPVPKYKQEEPSCCS